MSGISNWLIENRSDIYLLPSRFFLLSTTIDSLGKLNYYLREYSSFQRLFNVIVNSILNS